MKKEYIPERAQRMAIEVLELCKRVYGNSAITSQLVRCATSVGANATEARYAQSPADFVTKLHIALKECSETEYWLKILFDTQAIDEIAYKKVCQKAGSIRRMLIASIATVKNKN